MCIVAHSPLLVSVPKLVFLAVERSGGVHFIGVFAYFLYITPPVHSPTPPLFKTSDRKNKTYEF